MKLKFDTGLICILYMIGHGRTNSQYDRVWSLFSIQFPDKWKNKEYKDLDYIEMLPRATILGISNVPRLYIRMIEDWASTLKLKKLN